MADLTGYKSILVGGAAQSVPLKFHDNSDGTYSEVVYPDGGTVPTGAATAAKQDTGNTTLSTISSKLTGAANYANGQVTAATASGALVAARATRRSVTIRNQDTTNSAYIGAGTVTSGNGFLLKAGESIAIDTVAAINCIRATADVALAYFETYD
jgi:hypothetical protein